MQPLINIATRAARRAGNLMLQNLDRLDTLQVSEKGTADYVSDVDKACEAAIIETIHQSYPDHAILGEESGHKATDSDYLWIIDPLDGTSNYLHGNPNFCISIAIQHAGKTEHAVIYDPTRDELFTASRGQGAKLNNHRLRVGSAHKLLGTTLSSSITHQHDDYTDGFFNAQKSLYQQHVSLRRLGSVALDLAYVASGRFDACFMLGAKPWDFAAGVLLVKEAGGLICDLNGGETAIESGEIIASNTKVLKPLLQVLRPCFN